MLDNLFVFINKQFLQISLYVRKQARFSVGTCNKGETLRVFQLVRLLILWHKVLIHTTSYILHFDPLDIAPLLLYGIYGALQKTPQFEDQAYLIVVEWSYLTELALPYQGRFIHVTEEDQNLSLETRHTKISLFSSQIRITFLSEDFFFFFFLFLLLSSWFWEQMCGKQLLTDCWNGKIQATSLICGLKGEFLTRVSIDQCWNGVIFFINVAYILTW